MKNTATFKSILLKSHLWILIGLIVTFISSITTSYLFPDLKEIVVESTFNFITFFVSILLSMILLSFLLISDIKDDKRYTLFGIKGINLSPFFYCLITAIFGITFSIRVSDLPQSTILLAALYTFIIFVTVSLYAYYTKKDTSKWINYLLPALLLLIVFGVLSLYLGSLFMFIYNIVGIVLFIFFIVYDTNKIKDDLRNDSDFANNVNYPIYIALNLYLDIINIFSKILTLLQYSDD